MLAKAPPTTSSLNLVNSEVSDAMATPDAHDGIKMADLVESLDTRELDIGEGEETDYDGNCLGMFSFGYFLVYLKQCDFTMIYPRSKMIPQGKHNNKQGC